MPVSSNSIGAALKELENHGYIRRTQLRDEKGKITDTEYVIYEMPQCEPPSSPGTPLPGTAKPYTENPDMGIPDTAEPCTENPAQLNTNQTKTDLSSTELSNPIPSNPPTPAGARMGTDRMGARECYREVILDNIEYSYLVQDSHIDREQLDEIVDLIVDTVCSARKVIRIAGDDYPAEVVKSRFMKLDSSHVQYVMDCMLNEFIEKILVHERDRKGSIQTTQEVEIYFNFVGRFVPPAFGEVELIPEELEEIRKREERKDRLHQNYLKRKANGKQKEYEERTKAKKKAEIEARKQAIRTEDIARGVFIPVSSLPQLGPRKGA